jgi:tetratricopeptide (TPR) repeat protein
MIKHLILAVSMVFALAGQVRADGTSDLRQARELADKGEFETAIDYYSRAIGSGDLGNKELAGAYHGRGLAHGRTRDNDAAMADHRLAVRTDSTNVRALGSLCFQLLKHERAEDALRACNEALRLDADYGVGYGIRAAALRKLDRIDEAYADYTRALEMAPDNWILFYNRGLLNEQQSERARARADFAEAYRIAPAWGRVGEPYLAKFRAYGIGGVTKNKR